LKQTIPIQNFIESLTSSPDTPIFNPWYESDRTNDGVPNAPGIRRRHLYHYLHERQKTATHLLLAEAIGYQGGHFTGMAMTSERIMLGHKVRDGILPEHVFRDVAPERTSRIELKENGFSENTATIVWKALIQNHIDPYSVVLWNTFPWHPYDPDRGMLSNRTPTSDEFESGKAHLSEFLKLFPNCTIVALGRHAHSTLGEMGYDSIALRHPAFGGAPAFRSGLKTIFSR